MRSYPDHVGGPGSVGYCTIRLRAGSLGLCDSQGWTYQQASKQPSLWVLLSSWIMTWKCRSHKPSFPGCFWPQCLSLQQRGDQSRVLCVINFPFGYWDRDRPGTPGWALSWESSFLSLQCAGIAGMSQDTCLLCKLWTRAFMYTENSSGVSWRFHMKMCFLPRSLQLKASLNPWPSVNTDRMMKQ